MLVRLSFIFFSEFNSSLLEDCFQMSGVTGHPNHTVISYSILFRNKVFSKKVKELREFEINDWRGHWTVLKRSIITYQDIKHAGEALNLEI